jgi:alkanesulfonate monooxygenase SsuD/methylene tetrahydromethanopterin reductase-like flavin-dependent oxidoreductase (luciferase family)
LPVRVEFLPRLILIVLDTPARAQDAIARYRQSVSKDGKNARNLPTPGEGGVAGKDRFYGNVAAVRQGKHVVVALGTVDQETARKQLAQMAGNLK